MPIECNPNPRPLFLVLGHWSDYSGRLSLYCSGTDRHIVVQCQVVLSDAVDSVPPFVTIEDGPKISPSLSKQPMPAAHRTARGCSVSVVRVFLLRIAAPSLVAVRICGVLEIPNGIILHSSPKALAKDRHTWRSETFDLAFQAGSTQEPQQVAAHLETRCARRKHWAQRRVQWTRQTKLSQRMAYRHRDKHLSSSRRLGKCFETTPDFSVSLALWSLRALWDGRDARGHPLITCFCCWMWLRTVE